MFSKRVKHYHQWLRSAIPFKAKLDQIPSDSIRVQGPTKRPSLGHLYPVSLVKERHRKGGKRKISRVLQSPVPSTQAPPKVEASHRLKQAQHFSTCRKVQNGNPRVHPDFPGPRGMGIVDRPVGRIPSHPHPSQLKEVPKVLLQGPGVPVHLPTFLTGHSPPGLYDDRKGSETNGPLKRTQNSPIPGRLADQVPVPGGISKGHTGSSRPNPILGLDNQPGKIRTETYSGVFVRGLRIPPRFSPCKTHSREMAQTSGFDPTTQVKTCFDCKMFDVSIWVASLNGENGPGGTPSHEALSVSSQGALEISSVAGQPPSLDRSHCSPPRLVAKSLKCDERRRPSFQGPQYPTLYRRLKRRLGRSFRSKFYKRTVVRAGKKATHKCPGIEGGLPGPSRLQGPVPESNSVSCDGQLNSGSLHQQARGNSLSRDVRSPVENHDLVPSLPYNIESQAHSRVSECDGRPPIQVQPSAVNRMVSAPSGLQANLPEVVHPSCRLIRHSPESQTPSICVSYPRPKGLEHRCSEHKLDQPHGLHLPSYGSPSQGDPKDQAMPLPDHRDSPRLARDALVLGPSAALNRDPTTTPSVNDPTQTVPQLYVPQQSTTAEPPRLVSRSGQLQEQGFSVEVAERIAAPQRSSTRTIYRSKWALFEKWCRENSVDFSTPSVKQISDFFMYLYQDLNRRPSTIDGYRTAIVDTLGPTAQHIAHNADLHRLLSSFHRDRPKSSRNLPKWNLSVVLNELTKAPFEPMKDSDLKHLTLKTAFLLALASGKRRSEIHAWVANKVANLGQWEKVALFPSSDFIAKNQLAREGSQGVSPVTIPALTTIVDRQFKEDRTLCPVRALRFYLDRTKDLRGSRSLLFISFKKGHTSDIRPATLSSWLKQTILLCYKQADQQALDLVQVKAHDIRAFAASKAFYGGVSVDQIMQACHWKAHNTFTNFYLKDLTWSDTDNNMYLGPVVAAQQVLDPSSQTSCPRKEKRGGGGGGGHIRYNQVFRSLSQDLGIPLPSRCYG